MRYITIFIFTIAFLSYATITYAQKNEDSQKIPDVRQTFVSFEVQSIMELSNGNMMQLPSELTSYFDQQKPLATLHVNMQTTKGLAIINASYVFTSLQAYRQWRKKSETKKFVQFLQDSNGKQDLQMILTMRRRPLDTLVEYNNQN